MVGHGWFSRTVESKDGSFEYDTPEGKVVRATYIDVNYPLPALVAYYAPVDQIYVGYIIMDSAKNHSVKSNCSVCGHEVKERELFLSKYIGCMC